MRAVVLDPEKGRASTLALQLKELGAQVETATSLTALPSQATAPGLLFVAVELDPGLSVIAQIRQRWPHAEIVVTAATSVMETALKAIKMGASNYLVRPLRADQLAVSVERARRATEARTRDTAAPGALAGDSPAVSYLHDAIARAAIGAHPVLVLGAPGTEKERVARALGGQPFVPLTVPRSELLGAELSTAVGRAARGTLFLEDIADLAPGDQDVLLAATGARIVAASSRNLLEAVGRGAFRRDLLDVLSACTLAVPPLRDRMQDVPLVVDAHLRRRAAAGQRAPQRLSSDARATLMAYDWPGDVRELELAVDRASELGAGDVLDRRHLPPQVIDAAEARLRGGSGASEVTTRSLREMESDVIKRLLTEHKGDTDVVSDLLKIDRSTLYRKIKRYDIDLDKLKGP